MRNLRNKKLIILLSILALFALVLVGCGVDDIEEPVEEPMEEPMEEPAPPMEEEPIPAPEDDMNGEF